MIGNGKFDINNTYWVEWSKDNKAKLRCRGCDEIIYTVCNVELFGYCSNCIDMLKRLAEAGIS